MAVADRRREYETIGLQEQDLARDPVTQWHRWYDDAVTAGCTEPNAMTVATVDAEGRPDARYVLIRGVDERGFWFFTNTESAKGRDLAAHPVAALVFGWLELHRQVRVRGAVELVAADEVDAYFASRPRASQIASWASHQSTVLASRAELEKAVRAADARYSGDHVPRPPYAGGYRVVHDEVEFWQGRAARLHDRLRYRRSGDAWVVDRLAP